MITLSSSSFIQFILCLTVLLFVPLPCHSVDPDPLQDFCIADLRTPISVNGFPCKPASEVTSDDFFFDGLIKEGNTDNISGVNLTFGDVIAFPGVNTLGISMNRVDFAPGGFNTPHSHPRSSEIGLVVRGKILAGFVTTGNVFHSKVLTTGEVFVIPRGLVHFQLNVGKGKAQIFNAFNSHLPGAVFLPTTLFGSRPSIPDEVLAKTFQVNNSVIQGIKSTFGSLK